MVETSCRSAAFVPFTLYGKEELEQISKYLLFCSTKKVWKVKSVSK